MAICIIQLAAEFEPNFGAMPCNHTFGCREPECCGSARFEFQIAALH
jgi:hypothetical protein